MKKLLLTTLITLTLFSNMAFATPTIKANVNGMVCAFCAQGIEKKMRALSQTKDVYVNLKQRIVAVELKEGQTLSNETIKNLVKEAGYEVTTIEMVEQPVATIKATLEASKEAQ